MPEHMQPQFVSRHGTTLQDKRMFSWYDLNTQTPYLPTFRVVKILQSWWHHYLKFVHNTGFAWNEAFQIS